MDEVENPDVSPAGQAIAAESDILDQPIPSSGLVGPDEAIRPGSDTAEQLHLENAPVIPPTGAAKESFSLAADGAVSSHPIEQQSAIPPAQAKQATPKRPVLKRDFSSSGPPAQQPLPQAPVQVTETTEFPQDPPDSLTLADLKRIRAGFPAAPLPKQELISLDRVYDFEYQDSQSFPVELEEWFSYNERERAKLRQIHSAFKQAWEGHTASEGDALTPDWSAEPEIGTTFVQLQIDLLKQGSSEQQNEALQVLCYLALGAWHETAGKTSDDPFLTVLGSRVPRNTDRLEDYTHASFQIQTIVNTICLLARHGALPVIFELLQVACDRDLRASVRNNDSNNASLFTEGNESLDMWSSFTLMYLFVEVGRLAEDTPDAVVLHQELSAVQSKLLVTCTNVVAQLRWDENAPVPQTKAFLLLWKSILLCFGGIDKVEQAKASFRDGDETLDKRGQPVITASPLDYHLFRQEICSKYPAYQPPAPLFPFEPENNTILPPLRHRQSKLDEIDNTASAGIGVYGSSVMHQPIHIATPAPSPPPSPAGPGGKGGKKQNYQTNQMFPFLYPPLDAASNDLGGKGSTELQDALAGRKWKGRDIPTSILEAAELFAKRMKATRAMKQLWETRVDYMKFERGWREGQDNDDVDQLDLSPSDSVPRPEPSASEDPSAQEPQTDSERRLKAVSDYYRDALPQLQSVVLVLKRAADKGLHDLLKAVGARNGMQPGMQEPNGIPPVNSFENGNGHIPDDPTSTSEHVDTTRTDEITAKALTGILLLLLKWFRVSHTLRHEYLTQLLLDTDYLQFIIRLWQFVDVGRACHFMLDREELNFFNFCRAISRNPKPTQPVNDMDESEDEALPPPIKLTRQGGNTQSEESSPATYPQDFGHPPEVDELGYPQTPLPSSSIRHFSWRNTFTLVNYLRILQKMTRRKAHRSLLLVSYKSSQCFKKSLRVPVGIMRYYTLKLFKSQVPYCGRKWRQSNMKIITAVWLSVPADLRDDWLQGGGGGMGGAGPGDVDGTVEEAVPLEQSLRALTHWWNVRTYPAAMGVERDVLAEEQDFFAKELEKLDFGRADDELLEESLLDEAWNPNLEGY